MHFEYDVCVVGGCGHVGLPLSITFAGRGARVGIYDINDASVAKVASGHMPFLEEGAEPLLREALASGNLHVANDPTLVSRARHVIVIIGTPVDEHLNPRFLAMRRAIVALLPLLRDGQCMILRSTVYPGTTAKVADLVAATGKDVAVAFCPERVAEGKAIRELTELPQIVSGTSEGAVARASELFGKIARSLIVLEPIEAELTKIFANVWRYIQFATANQFFMIATDYGLDFYRIYDALTRDYPRMKGLPRAGFAAGPCLFKDTMQLAAASDNTFQLGHAAMLINEGLPNYVVGRIKGQFPLPRMTVGILGMAFKGESDDPRESLSYKLRKVLEYEALACLCTDVYIRDADFLPVEEVVSRSDLLVLGAPHSAYRGLADAAGKPLFDVWNFYGRGVWASR